jgi:outer membrane protein assembly complex protein YaeT
LLRRRRRPRARGTGQAAGLLLAFFTLLPGGVHARSDLESQLKTVAAVSFRGRRSVGVREIRAVLKSRAPSIWPWADRAPLRMDFLSADREAIKLVYRQRGFLDAQVRDSLVAERGRNRVRVLFVIAEGPRSRVASVSFEGVRAVPEEVLRRGLYARPRRFFNPAFLIADTALIARHYGERGYLPHVVGRARRETPDSLRVDVIYSVDEGPLYRLGRAYIVSPGAVRVDPGLVRRELLFKPGSVYKLSRVEESEERLYQTGLFSEVQIRPLPDSTNTQMEFFVQVRERKPRWLDAGVGSGTQERLRFVGQWGNRNLWGRGLQGLLGARLALDQHRNRLVLSILRGESSLLEPWFIGTRNRAQATIYAEKRADIRIDTLEIDKDDWGITFQLQRDFGRRGHLRLIQDNTWVVKQTPKFLDPTLSPAVKDSLLQGFLPRYSTHRLQLAGDRDHRDNPLTTSRGSLQVASAEVAGGPFKGSTSFTKFQLSSSWFTPFRRPGWVLGVRARGGLMKPFGARKDFIPVAGVDPEVSRVPTEDLFRLGGVNSVRGYDENGIAPTGGLALLNATVELRLPVVGLFGLEAFVDAGNVWARPEYIRAADFKPRLGRAELDPGDVRYVGGLGGRLNLAFAPVRLDLSWGSEAGHRAGRLQFAVGPAF